MASPRNHQSRWQLAAVAFAAASLAAADRWIAPGFLRFQYPELFLLGIPLWMLFQRWGQTPGVTGWLRFALLLVVYAAVLFAIADTCIRHGLAVAECLQRH